MILKKYNEGEITLRKVLPPSTRKESNKEMVMWKKGEDNIFSIKTKRSKSKNYDEVVIVHKDLEM